MTQKCKMWYHLKLVNKIPQCKSKKTCTDVRIENYNIYLLKLNIIRMSIHPKWIFRFKEIPIKISERCYVHTDKIFLKLT